MDWKNRLFYLVFSMAIASAGCTQQGARPETDERMQTPVPIPTIVLSPETLNPTVEIKSQALDPMETLEVTVPDVVLQDIRVLPVGAWAFQEPRQYQVTVKESQALITNEDESIMISMVVSSPAYQQTVAEMLAMFLGNMAGDIEGFQNSSSYPVTVGGQAGLAADVTGTVFGSQITGRAVVVEPGVSQVFYAFGFGRDGKRGQVWEEMGQELFESVLSSVVFLGTGATACEVSSDETYGYSLENPIQTGGGAFNGPGRERAYFQTLRGQNGETFTFERQGSAQPEETVFDLYEVTFDGESEPVTLYLDEYHYSPPKAPAGFSCIGPFPFGEP